MRNGSLIRVSKCTQCGSEPTVTESAIGCKQCDIYFTTVDSRGMKQVATNWNNMQTMEAKKERFDDLAVGDIFQFNYVQWLKVPPFRMKIVGKIGPIKVNALSLEFPMVYADIGSERLCIPKGNVKKLTQ